MGFTLQLLNPQSGYIKMNAYLLILCHVISVVKLSHCFLLSTVKNELLTLKSFRKQYQIIKQKHPYLNVGKLLRLNTHRFKPSLFLVFICVFWSLKFNMNGLLHKYFSVEVMFYNNSVRRYTLPMLSEGRKKRVEWKFFWFHRLTGHRTSRLFDFYTFSDYLYFFNKQPA